jgi:small basic protein
VRSGASTPHPVTWITWVAVSFINLITYYTIVSDSPWKISTAIVGFVSMSIICGYSFFLKSNPKISNFDKIIIVLTIAIGVMWQTTNNDRLANILVQIIFAISYLPTIKGLISGKVKEKPFPWWLAVSSYSLQIIAILIAFNGDFLQLLFPIVNGILGNGSVAVLSTIKNKQNQMAE